VTPSRIVWLSVKGSMKVGICKSVRDMLTMIGVNSKIVVTVLLVA